MPNKFTESFCVLIQNFLEGEFEVRTLEFSILIERKFNSDI